MIQIKKTILTLVALLAVTTGAWAEDTYTITFAANGNTKTVENVTLPVTYKCSYNKANGELDLILKELYGWTGSADYTYCNYNFPPTSPDASKVEAGKDGDDHYITIKKVFEGKVTVTDGKYYVKNANTNYTLEISFASTASTVEVAWNAASKTGTFKMPGGNVELEPEYYPQAVLTAAPTAIDNVPATTDGAIVKAGTVKNIGSTTNAQGTVMYYVSKDALDDAALLALAADDWTADVPTAETFTAAGQAYVYYYVRGNDGDTDEENFSDGDILAANALTVNIAAAPTYAVTFAEGTDPNEWTASPAANVTKGETVTVTYTGSKKVLGVKAEVKAAAPTLAETLTTAGMTVSVSFLVNGNAETVNFTSNGDGTYTKTGGTGTTATATDWTIQLVENSGMIVFKAYPSVDSENGIMAFRFHFFPSDNTYYMWAGMLAEGLNPTFTSISVNDTAIAVTEAQGS